MKKLKSIGFNVIFFVLNVIDFFLFTVNLYVRLTF